MAIREYIGARYVPRFLDTYSATTIYDALDVVDDGMGTSYIAKKTTPAGTPLTDTNYWSVYGASSGAILDLQSRMGAAENSIDFLGRKKIALLSDSYGYPSYVGGTSWEQFVETNMPDRTFIKQYLGAGGFGYDSASPYYFPSWFATFDVDNEVDMVLMLCGANDGNLLYYSESTVAAIKSGFAAGMATLRTKFPNAEIHVGFVGRYKQNVRFPTYKTARNAYIEAAHENNVVFANNFEYVLHDISLIDNGDVHPSLNGSRKIGYYATEYIKSNHIDVVESGQYVETGGGVATNFQFKVEMHNGTCVVTPNVNGSNSFGANISKVVGGSTTEFDITFSFACNNFNPRTINGACMSASLQYEDSGGVDHVLITPVTLFFSGGTMHIYAFKVWGENAGTYEHVSALLPTIVYDSMDC